MELGEKLRQARLEAGLSQRQVCGQRITRNMLSQIENGTAKPSMETLQYLAGQLGKSVGWFLGEDRLQTARRAWAEGDARAALEALPRQDDPEVGLLRYLCGLQLARQAILEDRLPYARQLLSECDREQSPYITQPLRLHRAHLGQQAGEELALPLDDYLLSQATREPDARRAIHLLRAIQRPDHRAGLLLGRLLLAQGEHRQALEQLQRVADRPEAYPLLEQCYEALGDYRQAYTYAVKQRQGAL